ncbi:ribonuclease Z [Candidatus Woesearchaeota archaeon]|nr:ribonuclease Z [Candidatus Woesearchaeota archaeon]
MIKLTFLGTSSQIPTATRNHTSILLNYQSGKSNENILIDCGENTQRQMRIARIPPTCLTKVFLTHWHGDHTLGLPGLIQNLNAHGFLGVLDFYGPKGIKKYFELMLKAFLLERKIQFRIHEIERDGVVFENLDFKVEAIFLNHTAPCLGYSFCELDRRKIDVKYLKKIGLKPGPILKNLQEGKNIKFNGKVVNVNKATYLVKGKKVSIILDTGFTKKIEKLVKSSDLLVIESTFSKDLKEKAVEYKHLTATDAGKIAKKCKVGRLVLTHISQRYEKDLEIVLKEAKKIFKNSSLAKDFMILEL